VHCDGRVLHELLDVVVFFADILPPSTLLQGKGTAARERRGGRRGTRGAVWATDTMVNQHEEGNHHRTNTGAAYPVASLSVHLAAGEVRKMLHKMRPINC